MKLSKMVYKSSQFVHYIFISSFLSFSRLGLYLFRIINTTHGERSHFADPRAEATRPGYGKASQLPSVMKSLVVMQTHRLE